MEEKKVTLTQQATFAGSTLLTMGLVDVLAHLGPTGLLVGGIASYIAWKHGPELYEQARGVLPLPERMTQARPGRSVIDRALGRYPEEPAEVPQEREAPVTDEESAAFVSPLTQAEAPGVPRITVEQIARHTERNSYEVFIGRSMSRPNYPAVKINFYKRHLKLIGASQHGKSSMAAALLDAITRTHDPELVQLAILDLEDRTGRLFEGLPHIARVRFGERMVRLHARSYEQVLAYLEHVSTLIEYRYRLTQEELERQPLLIVYLEEFIDLKNHFKRRVNAVEREEREAAAAAYARLVYIIGKIAARGLKVYVQFLMCAQCDYRDEDLQEALINVTSGMSFSVRPSAAQAAGFYQSELLARNAREDKVGQAVAEMPDCKDLILAPDYDLAARLQSLSRKTSGYDGAPRLSVVRGLPGTSGEVPQRDTDALGEQAEDVPGDFRPREDDLTLSEVQEQVFLAYYRACGNIGESLAQIKNERGQGLGARYHRHASYLLEIHGLKKRRA